MTKPVLAMAIAALALQSIAANSATISTGQASQSFQAEAWASQGSGNGHGQNQSGPQGREFGQAVSEAARNGGANFGQQVSENAQAGNLPRPPASVVPLPASAWLFGSAILAVIGVARRKKAMR